MRRRRKRETKNKVNRHKIQTSKQSLYTGRENLYHLAREKGDITNTKTETKKYKPK